MDLVQDVADYGDATEIFVSGISRISRVSNGLVRVVFFADSETSEGAIEKRVAVRLLCAMEVIPDGQALFAEAIAALQNALPLNGVGGAARRKSRTH